MNAALGQLDGLQVLAYGAVWTDGRPARDALDAGARAHNLSGAKQVRAVNALAQSRLPAPEHALIAARRTPLRRRPSPLTI